jgi:(2Fe-2S) ferredoxin
MISTSSFTPGSAEKSSEATGRANAAPETVDALLFPAFLHFTNLVATGKEQVAGSQDPPASNEASSARMKSFLLDNLSPSGEQPSQGPKTDKSHWRSSAITNPTILICSHGQRDSRCGILGPVLHEEFSRYIDQRKGDDPTSHISVARTPCFVASASTTTGSEDANSSHPKVTVNVGMVSHIGGHKWAGNVIIYFPPTLQASPASASEHGERALHPLAGMSVWYGRVEPRHVEGIVEETLVNGRVIKELCRGGLDSRGQILRV